MCMFEGARPHAASPPVADRRCRPHKNRDGPPSHTVRGPQPSSEPKALAFAPTAPNREMAARGRKLRGPGAAWTALLVFTLTLTAGAQ
jgi:hypothetical protein